MAGDKWHRLQMGLMSGKCLESFRLVQCERCRILHCIRLCLAQIDEPCTLCRIESHKSFVMLSPKSDSQSAFKDGSSEWRSCVNLLYIMEIILLNESGHSTSTSNGLHGGSAGNTGSVLRRKSLT